VSESGTSVLKLISRPPERKSDGLPHRLIPEFRCK